MNVQILHEAKNENSALPFGQNTRGLPDGLNLLVDRGAFFGRNRSICPVLDPFAINPLGLLPELIPASPQLIPDKIYGNPYQPRVDTALAAKSSPAFVRVPEAVLRQGFRKIHIAER